MFQNVYLQNQAAGKHLWTPSLESESQGGKAAERPLPGPSVNPRPPDSELKLTLPTSRRRLGVS